MAEQQATADSTGAVRRQVAVHFAAVYYITVAAVNVTAVTWTSPPPNSLSTLDQAAAAAAVK